MPPHARCCTLFANSHALSYDDSMQESLLLLVSRLYREASRCNLYGLRAIRDGQEHLALLFQAMAESHTRQADRFLLQIRGSIGDTATNEATAFDMELPSFAELFLRLESECRNQGFKAVAEGCRQSGAIIRMTNSLYRRLKNNQTIWEYHVCNFCGFIAPPDAPPEHCPVCTAPRNRFIAFTNR